MRVPIVLLASLCLVSCAPRPVAVLPMAPPVCPTAVQCARQFSDQFAAALALIPPPLTEDELKKKDAATSSGLAWLHSVDHDADEYPTTHVNATALADQAVVDLLALEDVTAARGASVRAAWDKALAYLRAGR